MRRDVRSGGCPSRAGLVAAVVVAALAGGCASPKPERFHTLLASEPAAAPVAASASAAASAPIYIDVLPVNVPAQVDHAQWVLRQGDDSLLLLEQERWAAPLRDELRGAVVARLTSKWGAIDVRGVAMPVGPLWRVRLNVQRFESWPGREARIEATWSLSSSQRDAPVVVCRDAASEGAAGADVPALAAAHRRALTRLADRIGERLKALAAGRTPATPCPQSPV